MALQRSLLLENGGADNDARVGLVRSLMAQERYDEANRIYAELPAEEKDALQKMIIETEPSKTTGRRSSCSGSRGR